METTVEAQGPVDVLVRPAFESETYYGVVLGTDRYLGWRCVYGGGGTLGFQHEDGCEVCFNHSTLRGWTKQCWDDFTRYAHRQQTAQCGNTPYDEGPFSVEPNAELCGARRASEPTPGSAEPTTEKDHG